MGLGVSEQGVCHVDACSCPPFKRHDHTSTSTPVYGLTTQVDVYPANGAFRLLPDSPGNGARANCWLLRH